MRLLLTVFVSATAIAISCLDAKLQKTIQAGHSSRVTLTSDLNYTVILNITINSSAIQQYSTLVVQAHTQRNVLTLNLISQNIVINGSHVGLLHLLTMGLDRVYYRLKCYPHGNSKDDIAVLIVTQLLADEAPIPGGCSTVSPLEYDPNIYLKFDPYTTTWSFSDANLGFNASNSSLLLICDDAKYGYVPVKNLEYYTYIFYLPERSYSVDHMFDGIENMLSSQGVSSYGDKSSTKLQYQTPKTVSYASTPGQGVVYNVIARDLLTGATSVYVPMVTYSCDFYAKIGGCDSLGSVINKVVGALVMLLGLLLCLFGHRFFDIELGLLLIVIFSFLLFIIITRFTDWTHTVRVSVSIVLGIVAALPFILIWCFTGVYYPFVILFGMFMSFLLGCTVFYTPIGNLSYFKYNYVYGLGIACCTIIFVLPFVVFAKMLNVTLCAFIGSYGVIFGISSYVQNSLSDIITDLLKQATIQGYSNDIEAHPYQLAEIILTCLWGILIVAGIIVQALLTRNRQKFPDSPYKRFKQWRTSRKNRSPLVDNCDSPLLQDSFHTNTASGLAHNNERRKLLAFDSMHVNYATMTDDDTVK